MAEKTKVVEVVPYDPAWKDEYLGIEARLLEITGDLIVGSEHVGSTSIEGLWAKPVIDIDLVMESYDKLPEIVRRLESYGYEHQGNLGIEGREAFSNPPDSGFMKYHLYVCPQDGNGYLEHIAFRDYLRAHPSARREYQAVKQQLAKQHRYDIDAYCEGKTAFVQSILQKAAKRQTQG